MVISSGTIIIIGGWTEVYAAGNRGVYVCVRDRQLQARQGCIQQTSPLRTWVGSRHIITADIKTCRDRRPLELQGRSSLARSAHLARDPLNWPSPFFTWSLTAGRGEV